MSCRPFVFDSITTMTSANRRRLRYSRSNFETLFSQVKSLSTSSRASEVNFHDIASACLTPFPNWILSVLSRSTTWNLALRLLFRIIVKYLWSSWLLLNAFKIVHVSTVSKAFSSSTKTYHSETIHWLDFWIRVLITCRWSRVQKPVIKLFMWLMTTLFA